MTLSIQQFKSLSSSKGYVNQRGDALDVVADKGFLASKFVRPLAKKLMSGNHIALKENFIDLIRKEYGGNTFNRAVALIDRHSNKPLSVRQVKELIAFGEAQKLSEHANTRWVQSKSRLQILELPKDSNSSQRIVTSLPDLNAIQSAGANAGKVLQLGAGGENIFIQASKGLNAVEKNVEATGRPDALAVGALVQSTLHRSGEGAMRYLSAILGNTSCSPERFVQLASDPNVRDAYVSAMREVLAQNPEYAVRIAHGSNGNIEPNFSEVIPWIITFNQRLELPLKEMQSNASKLLRANPESDDALKASRNLQKAANEMLTTIQTRISALNAQIAVFSNQNFLEAVAPEVGISLSGFGQSLERIHEAYTDPNGPVQSLLALSYLTSQDPQRYASTLSPD